MAEEWVLHLLFLLDFSNWQEDPYHVRKGTQRQSQWRVRFATWLWWRWSMPRLHKRNQRRWNAAHIPCHCLDHYVDILGTHPSNSNRIHTYTLNTACANSLHSFVYNNHILDLDMVPWESTWRYCSVLHCATKSNRVLRFSILRIWLDAKDLSKCGDTWGRLNCCSMLPYMHRSLLHNCTLPLDRLLHLQLEPSISRITRY